MTDKDAYIRELEKRIDALESQAEIRALQATYMQACDENWGRRIGELFTEDGIWEGIGKFASGFGPNVGREAIANMFDGDEERLTFTAHYLMNERIRVDGDTAEGKWMFLEPAVHRNTRQIWIAGHYINDFLRVDGRWFIKHLRCGDVFVSPYEEGWLKTRFIADLG